MPRPRAFGLSAGEQWVAHEPSFVMHFAQNATTRGAPVRHALCSERYRAGNSTPGTVTMRSRSMSYWVIDPHRTVCSIGTWSSGSVAASGFSSSVCSVATPFLIAQWERPLELSLAA